MRGTKSVFAFLLVLASVVLIGERGAWAYITPMSESLVEDALSESVPTAFAPQGGTAQAERSQAERSQAERSQAERSDDTLEDFSVKWAGPEIPGVKITLEPASLQWVRVQEVLVVPRARLVLRAEDTQGGSIRSGGFSQPLAPDGTAAIPVALISGASNPIDVTVVRGGRELRGRLEIGYGSGVSPGAPTSALKKSSIGIDSSCSRFDVSVDAPDFPGTERLYIGCRFVVARAEEHRTSSLEIYVFWDSSNGGESRKVRVGGAETDPLRPSLWVLRMRATPGEAKLEEDAHAVTIHYSIPETLHFGSLGFGLGPYSYQHSDPTSSVSSISPLLTFYGSYFFKESVRIIAFDATTLNNQWVTDFGIYLSSEYARVFDNRVALSLMLGAHAIGFNSTGGYLLRIGVPQGLEITCSDAFERNHNLSMGGFVFPAVDGKSYYNFWLRWGSPSVFVEINYILWTEQIPGGEVFSRSTGVSVGFPVARFL